MNTAHLHIGQQTRSCPICGEEWMEFDLYHLTDIGCPSCSRKFDLGLYMYADEPLWTDWREKCYDRMRRAYENGGIL